MRLTELGHSTSFRFALALTATFLAAYVVAGLIAFRAISADLDNRVIQAVELSAERYEDTYQEAGPAGLLSAIKARAGGIDADDEFIWLGSHAGDTLAGQESPEVISLTTGPATGMDLGAEAGDRFWIVVRDLGDLRLITGRSFEESDAIGRTVLAAFGGATVLILLLAALSATVLARRAEQRLNRISGTLAEVSRGHMSSRVPLSGSGDDLDRLSERINHALTELETTVESIRQVSIDIAHELRTPISRLGIRLENLLAETEAQTVLKERLESAAAEVRQITSTFDSLLRIAQIEAGARKSRFRPLALTDIASALHEAYLPVAEENGQQLTLNIAASATGAVIGDRDLLTQLFANLIENAMRHSPSGAHIRLQFGSDPGGTWISVADDGPGIPPQERANVVKRFYRLDKSRHTSGSALGLALVKAIADLHGAVLAFDDARPGLIVTATFAPCEQKACA